MITSTMNRLYFIVFGLLLPFSNGFQNIGVRRENFISRGNAVSRDPSESPSSLSLFRSEPMFSDGSERQSSNKVTSRLFRNARFDTIQASGLKNVHTAGPLYIFGIKTAIKLVKRVKTLPQDIKKLPQDIKNLTWKDVKPIKRIKKLHGPKFYLPLAFYWMVKSPKLLSNYAYWGWVAFNIKWYRARYVFKIPVWDRQPNWNNIITSKEQEKDLKAITCLKCGSTLFIAKTREWFFEGPTGLAGLGCFACGAKGKENFVMDRDRIVQNVADIDDYFDYERPLDFLSAAERRRVLKEAGGDEDTANKIVVDRENAKAEVETKAAAESAVNGATGFLDDSGGDAPTSEEKPATESAAESSPEAAPEEISDDKDIITSSNAEEKVTESIPSPSTADDDDMDILDMD